MRGAAAALILIPGVLPTYLVCWWYYTPEHIVCQPPFKKKSRFFIIFLYESLCDWHSLDDAVRENDHAAAQTLRGTKACES